MVLKAFHQPQGDVKARGILVPGEVEGIVASHRQSQSRDGCREHTTLHIVLFINNRLKRFICLNRKQFENGLERNTNLCKI